MDSADPARPLSFVCSCRYVIMLSSYMCPFGPQSFPGTPFRSGCQYISETEEPDRGSSHCTTFTVAYCTPPPTCHMKSADNSRFGDFKSSQDLLVILFSRIYVLWFKLCTTTCSEDMAENGSPEEHIKCRNFLYLFDWTCTLAMKKIRFHVSDNCNKHNLHLVLLLYK